MIRATKAAKYLIEMKNIIVGIICVLIGIIILFRTIKFPTKGDFAYDDYKGYLGGAGFIALGIGFLIGHFNL